MDNIATVEPTSADAARMEAEILSSLAEIQQLRERMKRDQAQIEASGSRTDAMLKHIQEQLAQLKVR